jgi:hypothetical protein
MLKRGTVNCPRHKVALHWKQIHGMRLTREIIPKKPKHHYYVYDAVCPKCNKNYEVKV